MPRRQDLMMRLKHYLGGLQSGRHDSPSSPKEGLVAHGFPLHTSRLFFLSLANAHQASGSDRIQEVDLTLLLTSREHRMEPIPPYHTVGASERPAHRTAAERLSSRGSGVGGGILSTMHYLGWWWERIWTNLTENKRLQLQYPNYWEMHQLGFAFEAPWLLPTSSTSQARGLRREARCSARSEEPSSGAAPFLTATWPWAHRFCLLASVFLWEKKWVSILILQLTLLNNIKNYLYFSWCNMALRKQSYLGFDLEYSNKKEGGREQMKQGGQNVDNCWKRSLGLKVCCSLPSTFVFEVFHT